jgi:hypothetical protein
MIKINEISTKDRFPVINFEYQNTGEEIVLITEFTIHVSSFKLDKKPFLNFTYEVVGDSNDRHYSGNKGHLEIFVKNTGFGIAKDCYVEIDDHVLNELFPIQSRCFNGVNIPPGQKVKICTLTASNLSERYKDGEIEMQAKWMGFDESGNFISETNYIGHDSNIADLFIKNGEFKVFKLFLQKSLRFESDRYCTMIDLNNEVNPTRSFKIFKEIKPGDIEKFQIMIGATKSAFIELDFEFKTNNRNIPKSKLFEIQIFNPTGLFNFDEYIDKENIRTQIDTLRLSPEKDIYLLDHLELTLKRIDNDEDYPFYFEDKLYNPYKEAASF